MYISFCFLPNFVGKYIPYFRQKGESVSIVQNVNRVVLNFLFHNNLAYALSNSGGVIDLVMSIGGYNVKIAGTSRGCKANSIEKRASGQERVDRDE